MQSLQVIWKESRPSQHIVTVTRTSKHKPTYDAAQELTRLSNLLTADNVRWCAEQFIARIPSCDTDTCKQIWTACLRMVQVRNFECIDLIAYLCKISRNAFQGQQLQNFLQNQRFQSLQVECKLYAHKVLDCRQLSCRMCDVFERVVRTQTDIAEVAQASEILHSSKAVLFCSSAVHQRFVTVSKQIQSLEPSKIKFQLQLALERLTLKEIL